MNRQNRSELQKAIVMLDEARSIIESIGEIEQEKYDNLSEGLQQSERGEQFSNNATNLADVVSQLEEAISTIEQAIE